MPRTHSSFSMVTMKLHSAQHRALHCASVLSSAFFFALLEALSVPQVAVWALPWEGLVADLQEHEITHI
eukprot:21511-Heterococcus_DN1.PRE.1